MALPISISMPRLGRVIPNAKRNKKAVDVDAFQFDFRYKPTTLVFHDVFLLLFASSPVGPFHGPDLFLPFS